MLLMDVAHSIAFIIVLVFLLSCHCLFADPSCIVCITDLHSVMLMVVDVLLRRGFDLPL